MISGLHSVVDEDYSLLRCYASEGTMFCSVVCSTLPDDMVTSQKT